MTTLVCCLVLCAGIDEEIRMFDEIRLRNGEVLRGLIRQEGAGVASGEVRIMLLGADGTVSGSLVGIPAGDILEILPRRTPQQIYVDHLRRLNLTDAAAILEFARWCAREDAALPEEALALAHRALRLDPEATEVYPLLAALMARLDLASLAAQDADREVELAMRARERGIFIASASLRAARVLLDTSAGTWGPLARESEKLFQEVRTKGAPGEAAAASAELAEAYLRWDRVDALRALLPEMPAEQRGPLRSQVIARLLLRGTPQDFEDANALIAELPEGQDRTALEAALAWRRGDAAGTETLLMQIVEETASPQAALALGVVLALQGKTKTAAELARIVPGDGDDRALLEYVLGTGGTLPAFTQGRAGTQLLLAEAHYLRDDIEEASRVLDAVLGARGAPPSVRALAWPLGAKLSFRKGLYDEAHQRLLFARAAQPQEGRIRVAQAAVYAREGRIEDARRVLADPVAGSAPSAARECTAAYIAYRDGDMQAAARLAQPWATRPGTPPATRAYAAELVRATWEATRLETWEDAFDRADGPDLLMAWSEDEKYGVRIGLEGGRAVFAGRHEGPPEAVTYLYTYTDWGRLYRVRVRLRARTADTVFGLQLTDDKRALRIEAAPDGTLASVVPGTATDKQRPIELTWRRDAWHTLELEVGDKGRLLVRIDGREAVCPESLRFAQGQRIKLGIYARGASAGGQVALDIDAVKFWRLSAEEMKKGVRRG